MFESGAGGSSDDFEDILNENLGVLGEAASTDTRVITPANRWSCCFPTFC